MVDCFKRRKVLLMSVEKIGTSMCQISIQPNFLY
ncbi:hypothetical protein EZS27_044207, partial [termite gut metagenome]